MFTMSNSCSIAQRSPARRTGPLPRSPAPSTPTLERLQSGASVRTTPAAAAAVVAAAIPSYAELLPQPSGSRDGGDDALPLEQGDGLVEAGCGARRRREHDREIDERLALQAEVVGRRRQRRSLAREPL